jgi:RNA polymerase sigma-70 factor (ECF subfamily)
VATSAIDATAAPPVTDHAEDDRAARLRRGEPAALQAMALAEAPRVARLLVRLLGPRADLDDLVQTVFLEACRALPRFRGDSTVSTFVAGIAVRVARRAMRPAAWWRRRAPMPADPRSEHGDPERATVANATLARVHEVLGSVSPEKRVAFLLWALDGMEPRAIAELMGASLPATRSRIYQAQRALAAAAESDPLLRDVKGGSDGT